MEALLEPFTSLPWLRKRPDPNDILDDIKEWLPDGSDEEAKVTAIQSLTSDARIKEGELIDSVQDLKQVVDDAVNPFGPDSRVTQARKELALKMAALSLQVSRQVQAVPSGTICKV